VVLDVPKMDRWFESRSSHMCTGFSLFCCPVYVEALLYTDLPFKESYQMPKRAHGFRSFLLVRITAERMRGMCKQVNMAIMKPV